MSLSRYFPDCEVFATRRKTILEEYRKMFGTKLEPIETADACTWMLYDPFTKTPTVVVFVKSDAEGIDLSGLVAHEATHCAQYYFEHIGETNPSAEFQAYVVQSFTIDILRHLKTERAAIETDSGVEPVQKEETN